MSLTLRPQLQLTQQLTLRQVLSLMKGRSPYRVRRITNFFDQWAMDKKEYARNRDALEELVELVPQRSGEDRPEYLIAGGWAVELLTGESREHDNINTIILQEDCIEKVVNSYHCGDYNWLGNSVKRSEIDVALRKNGNDSKDVRDVPYERVAFSGRYVDEVYVTSPEFLFVTKLWHPDWMTLKADRLREKDVADMLNLLKLRDFDRTNLAQVVSITGPAFGRDQAYELAEQMMALQASGADEKALAEYQKRFEQAYRKAAKPKRAVTRLLKNTDPLEHEMLAVLFDVQKDYVQTKDPFQIRKLTQTELVEKVEQRSGYFVQRELVKERLPHLSVELDRLGLDLQKMIPSRDYIPMLTDAAVESVMARGVKPKDSYQLFELVAQEFKDRLGSPDNEHHGRWGEIEYYRRDLRVTLTTVRKAYRRFKARQDQAK